MLSESELMVAYIQSAAIPVMPKITTALRLPLSQDFPAYVAWAQDLGYSPSDTTDTTAQTRELFAWLDEKRARLRALEPLLVPLEGNAVDDHGALVLALLELEREFAVNGFLQAHEDPVPYEVLVHDLDDLLEAESRFSARTFEVFEADLDTVLDGISGGGAADVSAMENAFLRLSVVVTQWLEWHPLFDSPLPGNPSGVNDSCHS